MKFWTNLWWWWLLSVALSWAVLEGTSILFAHYQGLHLIQEYTLSDTIRRWSALHRWLAPVAVGVAAMLVWHFFAQQNQAG